MKMLDVLNAVKAYTDAHDGKRPSQITLNPSDSQQIADSIEPLVNSNATIKRLSLAEEQAMLWFTDSSVAVGSVECR